MGRLRDTHAHNQHVHVSSIMFMARGPTSIDGCTMIDHHAPLDLHAMGTAGPGEGLALKYSKHPMCKRCNAKASERSTKMVPMHAANGITLVRSEAAVFVIGFCARQHAPLLHPSATVVRILRGTATGTGLRLYLRGYGLARSPLSLLKAPSLPPVLHQPKWLMTVRGGAFETPGEIEGDQDGPRWLMSITAHRAWPVDFVARRRRG